MEEVVKRYLGKILAIMIVTPCIIANRILTLCIDKDKANKVCGPYLTLIAEFVLKCTLPKINSPSEFDLFRNKIKKNLRLWKPLVDFSIIDEDDNSIKLHISHCPLSEILIKTGHPELAEYVCQGDLKAAENNAQNWLFKREHQIGRGDTFCDHTYKRKVNQRKG